MINSFDEYEAAKNQAKDKSIGFLVDINNELLEYRRQHNIFEVGDKVVYLSNIAPEHNDIYDVWKVDLIGCLVMLGDMDYRAMYDQIRHATDEEIKAGCRLWKN